jgi:hypothetical protein
MLCRQSSFIPNSIVYRALQEVGSPARIRGAEAKTLDTFDRVMPNSRAGAVV